MLMLPWIFKLNNYISIFLSVHLLFLKCFYFLLHFKGDFIMDNYLNSFREMISLRGLTDHTLKNYCTYIRAYLDYLSTCLHKLPEDVSWPELRDYIKWLQNSGNLSDRTINCAISQLRFLPCMSFTNRGMIPSFLCADLTNIFPLSLPNRIVSILINSMPDLKQKAMVALMYSSGLRIGEVCHLRYEDIQRQNMRIHIRHGKNRSDRYAILSKRALDILTAYWFAFGKPVGWLFPKQYDSSKPIDTFYLSRHIHEVERSLGWEQRITCHSLRHAFGTHLYEDGVDLLTIKALLGHKSINSTTIYVHLASNGTSDAVIPFDLMGGGHAQ